MRQVGVIAIAILACALAGCSSDATTPAVHWTRATLPHGFAPSVLTPLADGLLVASDGAAEGKQAPRLARLTGTTTIEIPVKPSTFYGTRGTWRGLATYGPVVFGFAGRSGGAHGNIRWTAWAGSWSGVTEQPQLFETFGGPDAGALNALVVPDDGRPIIVGSRVSPDHSGLDIAIWDLKGARWVRRTSAGTALAQDATNAPTVQSATRRGAGVLISGGVTRVVDGRPHLVPSVWPSTSSAGPWTRIDLPAPSAGVAEAQTATCAADGSCLVVGFVGERTAAWTLSASGATRRVEFPGLPAGPTSTVFAPVGSPGSYDVAVVGSDGASHLLAEHGSTWRQVPLPKGTLLGFTEVEDRWWVSTSTGALWSAPVDH